MKIRFYNDYESPSGKRKKNDIWECADDCAEAIMLVEKNYAERLDKPVARQPVIETATASPVEETEVATPDIKPKVKRKYNKRK